MSAETFEPADSANPAWLAEDVADAFVIGFFETVRGGQCPEILDAGPDALASALRAYLDACTAAYCRVKP